VPGYAKAYEGMRNRPAMINAARRELVGKCASIRFCRGASSSRGVQCVGGKHGLARLLHGKVRWRQSTRSVKLPHRACHRPRAAEYPGLLASARALRLAWKRGFRDA